MSMTEWAEREVALAKKQNDDRYYGMCLDSALKAYKCLMEDGHSGMSFDITAGILKRLMADRPLTPITDADFDGPDPQISEHDVGKNEWLVTHKQCPRMPSLFRYETKDGRVFYRDVDRVSVCNPKDPRITWYSGLIANVVDEMFPITMPYDGSDRYLVNAREYLSKAGEGRCDFDTIEILAVVCPNGDCVPVERYFYMAPGQARAKEIGKDEFVGIVADAREV